MDNQRLFIWAGFGLLAFMTYQAWLQDYAPRPSVPAPVSEELRGPATPAFTKQRQTIHRLVS